MASEIHVDAIVSTTDRKSDHNGRVQIVAPLSDRRSWTPAEKLAILDEAFNAGGSVSRTAERHAPGLGQIYVWRHLLLDGALGAPKCFARTC